MLRKVDLKIYLDKLIYKIIKTDRRTELHVQGDVDTKLQMSEDLKDAIVDELDMKVEQNNGEPNSTRLKYACNNKTIKICSPCYATKYCR